MLHRSVPALVAGWMILSVAATADEPKERTFIDPAKAGPDFLIQGEYEGKIGADTVVGLQVVALGDGKFDAAMYAKGLPGSGADKTRVPLKGETKEGVTTFTGSGFSGPSRTASSPARSTTSSSSSNASSASRRRSAPSPRKEPSFSLTARIPTNG